MTTQRYEYGIGALAERSGCKVETIRYYERIGLLPAAPRTMGGHRKYSAGHLQRLLFIRRSRDLGFGIDAIRQLLSLVDGGDYTCEQIRAMTVDRLEDVRAKISDLRRMEAVLDEMVAQCAGGSVPDCPILDALGMPR